MDGWMEGWMDGWMDGWTKSVDIYHGESCAWMDEECISTKNRMVGLTKSAYTHEDMDGWMDEW